MDYSKKKLIDDLNSEIKELYNSEKRLMRLLSQSSYYNFIKSETTKSDVGNNLDAVISRLHELVVSL